MGDVEPTNVQILNGQLVDITGKTLVEDVEVLLSVSRGDGTYERVTTRTTEGGHFALSLPEGDFVSALIAPHLTVFEPVQLELVDGRLVAGDMMLFAS